MKKILFICLLMFGMNMYSQANYNGNYSDTRYAYLELVNGYGTNIVDFKLTYDNETGKDNCYNNIQVIAQDIDININFKIYLNDSFYDCNSSRKEIKITTTPRYE